jgi:ABC-type nitrate/sulfonate/bicarbonate transport system ATPase subunit
MSSIPYTKHERLITVAGLGVSFSGKTVLRDISFVIDNISRPGVEQGQVVAVLGPSGCGKTTLLRCIAGLQQRTLDSAQKITGTIALPGGKAPDPGDVGVVFQNYPLLQHRTVKSNIEVAAKNKELRDRAFEMVKLFGLEDKLSSWPSSLSGGQRQRLAIVQQLAACEHLLVLDEPFSGLDPLSKRSAIDVLRKVSLANEHNTLFIVSHDIRSAVQLADTVWVLGHEAGKDGATIVKEVDLIDRDIAWHDMSDPAVAARIDATSRELEASF